MTAINIYMNYIHFEVVHETLQLRVHPKSLFSIRLYICSLVIHRLLYTYLRLKLELFR